MVKCFMWTSHLHQIDHQTIKVTLSHGSQILSYHQVIDLWQGDGQFRKFFAALISQSSFDAFFWETPPVARQTLKQSFEFVLVESASLLQLRPDPSSFASHFSSSSAEVLTFPNLGGDAILIVPKPLSNQSCYTHLAQFLRNAPASQVDAFWRTAGLAMAAHISDVPIWLSTAGLGVPWLHLRLDSRPKYYRHDPYKTAA